MDTQIRLQIDTQEPFAGGMEFGEVGPYEKVVGQVSFAVDPDAPGYQGVVDIEYAPRNEDGMVRKWPEGTVA